MSSRTATLTPAHVGALPSNFAVPTTSYWDTLQEVDRIACIDPHKSRKLGRKTGWFPAGALLKRWTEEIYPAITKIINDAGNYEKIFGKHNKEVSRPCWLYMVGESEQWMTARPTIVAICSKTRIAQRICDLLQNIACMRTLNLGFDYMHHKEKVVLVTGDGDPAALSNLPTNLCGLRVLASTYPASPDAKWTQTTVGGTLKINQEHYCLSVAHAFHLDASVAGDGDPDSSSDTDNGSHEPDDLYSTSHPTSSVSVIACRPDVLENVDLGLYFGSGPISTGTRDLEGQIRCSSMTTDNFRVIGSGRVVSGTAPSIRSLLLCTELDWVLVRVSDPQFFGPNLVHTPSGTTLSPQRVSMKPPRGKVLVAAGVSGVFESYSPGIIGGLSLPGSFQIVDVWTIESLCLPGDCGSWVIDPVTGDIYGIIIATAPEAKESYMIPAYQVYGSIKSCLPRGTAAEFAETQKETQALSQDAADIVSEASDMMGAGRGTHSIKRSHSTKSDFQKPVLTLVTERSECSIQNSLQVPIGLGSARSIPSSVARPLDLDSAVFDDDRVAANALRRLLRDAWDAGVDARGGSYVNALQAASLGGYEKTVELLLDLGADVNTQGGEYGNALQAASYGGHEKIVGLLLNWAADVNAQGGHYGNALQAASYGGHEKIVELLLNRGVDVNTEGGEYGNALQAASYGGHEEIVELLLDWGVDVKAQGGHYGNALQAALSRGHEKIVKLLLNRGEVRPSGRMGDSMGDAQKPLWDLLSRIFNNDRVAANVLKYVREARGEVSPLETMGHSMEDAKKPLWDLLSAVFDDDHVAARALRQLLRDGRGEVRPSESMEDSIGHDEIRSAFNQGRPIQPLLSGFQTSYQPVHSVPPTPTKRKLYESEGLFPMFQPPNLRSRSFLSSASPVVQPANVDFTTPRPSLLGALSKPRGKLGRPSREEIARRQAEAAAEGRVYVPQVRIRNKPKMPKTLFASPVPPSAGASASMKVSADLPSDESARGVNSDSANVGSRRYSQQGINVDLHPSFTQGRTTVVSEKDGLRVPDREDLEDESYSEAADDWLEGWELGS